MPVDPNNLEPRGHRNNHTRWQTRSKESSSCSFTVGTPAWTANRPYNATVKNVLSVQLKKQRWRKRKIRRNNGVFSLDLGRHNCLWGTNSCWSFEVEVVSSVRFKRLTIGTKINWHMHNFFHHSAERQITEPPSPTLSGGRELQSKNWTPCFTNLSDIHNN